MTRHPRAAAAVLAGVVVALLAGCTAQPSTPPSTAPAPAAQRFACPTASAVSELAAVPFAATAERCVYATDGDDPITVTVRHPAVERGTLARARAAAMEQGVRTNDAPSLAFDAFTAIGDHGCAAWFPAVDGIPTAVTVRREVPADSTDCDLATTVATLTTTGSPSAPTVAVIAPRSVLGTTTTQESWPFRVGRGAARVARITGNGFVDSTRPSSFAAKTMDVPADSAAIVFIGSVTPAGADRIARLAAATSALSTASTRVPDAALVVVGPLVDPTASYTDFVASRDDLRSAARIAGARFIDPNDGTSAAKDREDVLTGVAARVTRALQASGVIAG